MKRVNFYLGVLSIVCLLSIALAGSAQGQATVPSSFEVMILKPDGTPFAAQERTEEKAENGIVQFNVNDRPVKYEYKETDKNQGKYLFESPLLKDGSLCVGFRFPLERNLPVFDAKPTSSGLSVVFKDKSKTTITFSGIVEFLPPKPRKKLSVSLAEYGANDRWMDVTAIVKNQQIGDSLEFRPNNVLFGKDPAPGVPKSVMLTYTLEDEDDETEELKEFREGSLVQIQFDPKDQYFRFIVKDSDRFELNVRTDAKK